MWWWHLLGVLQEQLCEQTCLLCAVSPSLHGGRTASVCSKHLHAVSVISTALYAVTG